MPYSEEIKIALIILAVVLTYAFIIRPQIQQIKQRVLERYLLVQSFSLNMQDLLLNYILKHDAMHETFIQGITYKAYLRDLQKKHSLYLSDKKYKKVKQNVFVLFTVWLGGLLDNQEERLQKVEQELSGLQRELNIPQNEAVIN